ncbi:MAG: hypothetical protein NTX63_03515 [Candidatus Peregrinibacteria bacterium]|nr:hypothetical protein [Candidatus Peregrinibacteria bacterium]
MCQPGSRGLSARSERSVPVGEIYRGSNRLGGVGGRPSLRPTPAAAPRVETQAAVAAISGPTAGNVAKALTETPAAPTATRRVVSSTPVMRPVSTATKIAPADFQASVRAHRDDILGQLAAATASVQAQPSNSVSVVLPSGVEFRGNDVQKRLVGEFLKINQQVAAMPTGVEHKDARKAARARLCFQIQNLLGMRFVDADKRRFARTVSAELASRLPADTNLSQILPVFIQDWAEGKNM